MYTTFIFSLLSILINFNLFYIWIDYILSARAVYTYFIISSIGEYHIPLVYCLYLYTYID